MTRVEVGEYDDLRGDQRLRSRAKDAVVRELADGSDAVLWLDDWLVDEKSFDVLGDGAGIEQLVVGRLVAETEKAYLFTQSDERDPDVDAPGTDWVPKSYARVYESPSGGADDVDDSVPQRGLDEFGVEW